MIGGGTNSGLGELARPLRLAHRGDWRRAPENSLAALVAAMTVDGCDGVEFDVRIARDGVPVVIHDPTLARVQGVDARVDGMDAAALAAHAVPTLADVLVALPPRAFLDVELKGDDHGVATASVLRSTRGHAPRRAVVSSFEPAALAAMRDLLPGWPRWLNADDLGPETLRTAIELGCAAVSVRHDALDAGAVTRARRAGLAVAAWTVRTLEDEVRLDALGVVAMCVEDDALEPGGAGA
jgi:glycerophosphoryl diester phosphodiesterase